MIFDPIYSDIDFKTFNYNKPWVDFYGNVIDCASERAWTTWKACSNQNFCEQ